MPTFTKTNSLPDEATIRTWLQYESTQSFIRLILPHFNELKTHQFSDGNTLLHIATHIAITTLNHDTTNILKYLAEAFPNLNVVTNHDSLTPKQMLPSRSLAYLDVDPCSPPKTLSVTDPTITQRLDLETSQTTYPRREEIHDIYDALQQTLNEGLANAIDQSATADVTAFLHAGAKPNGKVRGDLTPLDIAAKQPQHPEHQRCTEVFTRVQSYADPLKKTTSHDIKNYYRTQIANAAQKLIAHIALGQVEKTAQTSYKNILAWRTSYTLFDLPSLSYGYHAATGNSILHALASLPDNDTTQKITNFVLDLCVGVGSSEVDITTNLKNHTPLHLAAQSNNETMSVQLIEHFHHHQSVLQDPPPHDLASKMTSLYTRLETLHSQMQGFAQIKDGLQRARTTHDEILKFLEVYKDARNHLGDSPLMHVIKHCPKQHFDTILKPIIRGALSPHKNHDEETCWHYIGRFQPKYFAEFIEEGAPPDHQDINQQNCLHHFLRKGDHDDLMAFANREKSQDFFNLLKHQDQAGDTPFNCLLQNPNKQAAAKVLMEWPTVEDRAGFTPFHYICWEKTKDKELLSELVRLVDDNSHYDNWLKSAPDYYVNQIHKPYCQQIAPIVTPDLIKKVNHAKILGYFLAAKPELEETVYARMWELKPITMRCIRLLRLITLPLQALGFFLGLFTWNRSSDCHLAVNQWRLALTNGYLWGGFQHSKKIPRISAQETPFNHAGPEIAVPGSVSPDQQMTATGTDFSSRDSIQPCWS